MIRSRRAAITASLIGALLIAGVPTLAFGQGDATREAKGYSATAASDEEIAAQKARDDEKKDAEKKAAEKKAAEKKADRQAEKKADKQAEKKADKQADKKKADDARKASDNKRKSDDARDNNKNEDKASDRRRHDNDTKKDDGKKDDGKKDERADRKRDHGKDGKRDVDDKDEWRRKKHNDKNNRDWDYNQDRDRHRRKYGWDTNRRYYKYGYYGAGWYDNCGFYGPNYRGDGDDYYYYGPDACGYEYGGYRSQMLVNMSWDQVIPRSDVEAYGVANLDINVQAGEVCFRLAYDGIDRAIGAQIHPGRRGEVGPSLVPLHVGSNGDDGCVRADPRILYEIQNDPRGYYLEINDEEFGQVMRGQLDAPDYRNRY